MVLPNASRRRFRWLSKSGVARAMSTGRHARAMSAGRRKPTLVGLKENQRINPMQSKFAPAERVTPPAEVHACPTVHSAPCTTRYRCLPTGMTGSRSRPAPRAAFFDVLPGRAWVPSIDHYEAKAFGHAEAPFGPARTQARARERLVPLGLHWRQPRGSGRVSPCLQRPALPLFQKCAVVSF
jgi:hypothetical protein